MKRASRTRNPSSAGSAERRRRYQRSQLTLDPAAFQSAVAKGLGRAIQAVRDGAPGTYDDLIIESCLHDQQHSRYSDALRYPYQMRLIDLAGLEERVLQKLLSGLRTSVHTGEQSWMIATLGGYAQRGDEAARQALQERSLKGNDWAQEILASTGSEGLEWLVANVLTQTLEGDDRPVYGWLPRENLPDETPTQQRLRAILAERLTPDHNAEETTERPTFTPREFLDRLHASDLPKRARSDFLNEATDDEYRELVEAWLADPSGAAQGYALWILPCRPLPVPFERIVKATESPRANWMFRNTLRQMDHPEVRAYALRRLEERPVPYDALIPLQSSFEPGDETAIAAALPQIAAQEFSSRFGLIMDLRYLMRDYDQVDWQPFAEWIYEQADDSWQRREAVEWMAEFGTIPDAIRQEGVEDAEPVVRRICEDLEAWLEAKRMADNDEEG